MIILLVFAVLAGAGTALSPCVLPVLPALLSASAVGGRRRPLGIVLGLAVTFTATIVGVATVTGGVGLDSQGLRTLAVVTLIAFGVVIVVPALADRVEAPLSRLARFGPRGRGDGFRSGLLVGGALGFVYTPCAGPILASVTAVGAASGRTVAVAVAYALGSAAALLVLAVGGRWSFERLRVTRAGPAIQRTLGLAMVLTGVVIATNSDVRFTQFVAQNIPDVNLTAGLEHSHAVESRLPKPRYAAAGVHASLGTSASSTQALAAEAHQLPDAGPAPALAGTQRWFNTPGGRPLTLTALRGRVVLIDFWTYTCINCIRTLPYLEAWDARYRTEGLTIIGVHTPEFGFEHDTGNVAAAIRQFGIRYPVVQDNDYATWNAYGNQFWPADYLIDARGHVRDYHAGEGDYGTTEQEIRALLAAAGHMLGGTLARPRGVIGVGGEATPETYLGAARAQGWVPREPTLGLHEYAGIRGMLQTSQFAYGGAWRIGDQAATAVRNATIDAEVAARDVYLVLSPPPGGRVGQVRVQLDGKPIPAGSAGADVHGGMVDVTRQRLYSLVALPATETSTLQLRFSPGVSGYAFTFG